jgi:hypothetical protein
MGFYVGTFPHTLHEFKVAVGGNLVIVYQLDCYQRWVVHVLLFLGGLRTELFFDVVGKADAGWVDNCFEGVDERE